MTGDSEQDTGERSNLQGIVIWNGDVMFALLLRCNAYMRSFALRYFIAIDLKGFDKLSRRQVAWKLHAGMTSSRTKCKRIIVGLSLGSK